MLLSVTTMAAVTCFFFNETYGKLLSQILNICNEVGEDSHCFRGFAIRNNKEQTLLTPNERYFDIAFSPWRILKSL